MCTELRILVTGAAGRIGYAFIPMLCNGLAFGQQQKLDVVLFDIPEREKYLEGVKMEIADCGYAAVNSVIVCTDPEKAFVNADVVVFLGAAPRTEGMQRADLLNKNKAIFEKQGKLMEKYSKKTVKALVVGNPANTNALVLSKSAPSIPKENITSLMRLDQNRTTSMLCSKMGFEYSDMSNVIVWGNHSPSQCPCVDFAKLKDGNPVHLTSELRTWVNTDMVPAIRKRGYDVIVFLGSSSAFSAAKAISDQLHDWFFGTPEGHFVSMGVASDGSYGIQPGLVFGLPVKCIGGFRYEIVKDLSMPEELSKQVEASKQELVKEKELASA